MSKTNVSRGYRALEIIIGIIAIIVALLVLFYPGVAVVTAVFFFGLALMVVGILRVGTAAFSALPKSARYANAAIGIIAIIISALILFYPGMSTAVLIILLAIGLLIYGVGRMAVGGVSKQMGGGLRALLLALGILMIIFAIIVIIFPVVGLVTLAILISIAFLFLGVDSLASGIVGVPLT